MSESNTPQDPIEQIQEWREKADRFNWLVKWSHETFNLKPSIGGTVQDGANLQVLLEELRIHRAAYCSACDLLHTQMHLVMPAKDEPLTGRLTEQVMEARIATCCWCGEGIYRNTDLSVWAESHGLDMCVAQPAVMKVRIVKANPHAFIWYNQHIGEIFEVKDTGETGISGQPAYDVIGEEEPGCIDKSDCEIVPQPAPNIPLVEVPWEEMVNPRQRLIRDPPSPLDPAAHDRNTVCGRCLQPMCDYPDCLPAKPQYRSVEAPPVPRLEHAEATGCYTLISDEGNYHVLPDEFRAWVSLCEKLPPIYEPPTEQPQKVHQEWCPVFHESGECRLPTRCVKWFEILKASFDLGCAYQAQHRTCDKCGASICRADASGMWNHFTGKCADQEAPKESAPYCRNCGKDLVGSGDLLGFSCQCPQKNPSTPLWDFVHYRPVTEPETIPSQVEDIPLVPCGKCGRETNNTFGAFLDGHVWHSFCLTDEQKQRYQKLQDEESK